MGPQGNGFSIDFLKADATALIVGGGNGEPPLVELAKQLHEHGVRVTAVLGFANKDAVILEEELALYADVIETTDAGSYGIKGYVSTVIDEMTQSFDAVYACGAPGMLDYVDRKIEKHPQAYITMESRMACGMGSFYSFVVHLRDQSSAAKKRVSEDGPVFETGSIILE